MVALLVEAGALVDVPSRFLCWCFPIMLFPAHPGGDGYPRQHKSLDKFADKYYMPGCTFSWNPLHIAMCYKRLEIAKYLIHQGASIYAHLRCRAHDNENTILHDAAENNNSDLRASAVSRLLANIKNQTDSHGLSAIWSSYLALECKCA
ncbi:hypothetical protein B0T17DRAFT_85877 [Bombardia bombarda]|uniref:Uncharacterized protein n=1 Tax=Bombardia bombarda TaxID=252184 RepID=A0AA40CFR5_9PEZI|nr:hypothetical protein B0T17DRAFT_85877 [Bombardia bombarda]